MVHFLLHITSVVSVGEMFAMSMQRHGGFLTFANGYETSIVSPANSELLQTLRIGVGAPRPYFVGLGLENSSALSL